MQPLTAVLAGQFRMQQHAAPDRTPDGPCAPPLAGSLAHAINGPLAALIGNLELLLETGSDQEGRMPRALRLAYRIREVVERTLQLHRCGRIERRPERIEQILGDVQIELEQRACRAGVALRLSVDPALPRLEVDRPLIAVALMGLAENALDAMPGGGELVLRAEYARGGDAIAISLIDSGPGIPHELRERVFEPFFSTKSGGTGLGMSIAGEVARAHGGRIEVGDRPGGGAAVRLELPRRGRS
jgi:signal transduction histidine kinase